VHYEELVEHYKALVKHKKETELSTPPKRA
jgi:hypothetical protein